MEESALLTDWMSVRQQINEHLDRHLSRDPAGWITVTPTPEALAEFERLTRAEEVAHSRYVSGRTIGDSAR